MAKAYKCDLTGKLIEGDGQSFVDVPVSDGKFLRVTVFVAVSKDAIHQGNISPDAGKVVSEALGAAKFT